MVDFNTTLVNSLLDPSCLEFQMLNKSKNWCSHNQDNSVHIVTLLVNQSATGSSAAKPAATSPFIMWEILWQKLDYFLTHTVMIKLFGQHMQSMSKRKQKNTHDAMSNNKYAVGNYWKIIICSVTYFVLFLVF